MPHAGPGQSPSVNIDVTHKQQSLIAVPGGLVLNGVDFPYAEIRHVAWAVETFVVNNAYQGSTYYFGVGTASQRQFFQMDGGGARDSRLDECRAWYLPVVADLSEQVLPRLVIDALSTLRESGRLTYGGPTGWLVTQRGIRSRVPLGRTTPWDRIAGLVAVTANVRLRVRGPGDRETQRLFLARRAWDVPVLEGVLQHHTERPAG